MAGSIDHYAPLPTRAQLARLAEGFASGGSVGHERRIEGGLGCTMDVLAATREDGSVKRVVLRRYGPWGNPGEDHPAPIEAHALELAARHGVPVPEVLWIDQDEVFAEPALIMSYIDGTASTRPEDPIDWADQLADALASIHKVPLSGADYDVIERAVPGSNDDGSTIPDEMAPHALGEALWKAIIDRRSHLVDESDCFLHADFWPGNTLWRDGRLLAVVDWEHPALGDPALDVAYAAMDMRYVGLDRAADRFVESYRRATGRTLPNLGYWNAISLARPMPDIGRWHPSFVAFGHSISLEGLRSRHMELIESEIAQW